MGAILDPTRDMAPWRVEARSRSAYFTGGHVQTHRVPDRDLHSGFAVRHGQQARGLLAAFEQALTHPACSAVEPEPGGWQTWTHHDGWIRLEGPCYCYGADGYGWVTAAVAEELGEPVGVLEIEYATLREAHAALLFASQLPSPPQ